MKNHENELIIGQLAPRNSQSVIVKANIFHGKRRIDIRVHVYDAVSSDFTQRTYKV